MSSPKQKTKVLVTLSGGLIRDIYSNNEIDLVICDFDVEGSLEEDDCGEETDVPMLANVFRDKPVILKTKFYKKAFGGREDQPDKEEQYARNKLKELDF